MTSALDIPEFDRIVETKSVTILDDKYRVTFIIAHDPCHGTKAGRYSLLVMYHATGEMYINGRELPLHMCRKRVQELIKALPSDSRAAAVAAWNQRPGEDALRAEVARAKEKAEMYSNDFYDAKSEFGTAMGKSRRENDALRAEVARLRDDLELIRDMTKDIGPAGIYEIANAALKDDAEKE